MAEDVVGKWGTYFIQRPDRTQDDDGEDGDDDAIPRRSH